MLKSIELKEVEVDVKKDEIRVEKVRQSSTAFRAGTGSLEHNIYS